MNTLWKNSLANQSLLACALALLLSPTPARADQPVSDQEYSVNTIRHAPFPTVQFEDITFEALIDNFWQFTSKIDCGRRVNLSFVLDRSRLTEAQLQSRITIREKDMTLEELLYAVCKRLGVGYRMDEHAIFISSRDYVGLPEPPSKRVAAVPDGRVTAYVIIVGRDKS
ncbi:hypothetical protein DES53_103111 [Roseimicrobium gellanilyticum]|uniref:Uncharacterized protein n=2 Tax=Roseimicrobium gellanilyticum TaxID=748857 RepID=A0A366HPS5_9BACT|nr:hypothetical protein DES53_103111 [Roseimicrobium gellanilyticum]